MKSNSVLLTTLITIILCSVAPRLFSVASAEIEEEIEPRIQFEILDATRHKLYERHPPSDGLTQESQIPVLTPVGFSKEKIIFWKHKNPSLVRLRLKVTCKASYFTRWKITGEAENSEQDNSLLTYTIKALPRDNENPLYQNSEDLSRNSLTEIAELTIESFDSKFKSGSVECIKYSNESIKSQLYIFQRFDDSNKTFKSSPTKNIVLSPDAAIPCKVHDPDLTPYLYKFQESAHEWAVTSRFSYNWNVGFTRNHNARPYSVGDTYSCAFNQNTFLEYIFVGEPKNPPNTVIKDRRKIRIELVGSLGEHRNRNRHEWKFICHVIIRPTASNRNAIISIKSMQLENCVSPDYCDARGSGSSTTNLENTDKQCTGQQCEMKLPPSTDPHGGLADVTHHGKVNCLAEVGNKFQRVQEHYFQGLSGRFYLLSQSPPVHDIVQLSVEVSGNPTVALFACAAVNFLTFPSIKLSLTYKNNTRKMLANSGRLLQDAQFLRRINVPVKLTEDVESVNCHVPWFNQTEWLEVSHNLYQTESYLPEHVEPEIFISPLPSVIPALTVRMTDVENEILTTVASTTASSTLPTTTPMASEETVQISKCPAAAAHPNEILYSCISACFAV